MARNHSESGTVNSDLTLFRIVEALQDFEKAGVTELAEHLDIPKGTVHKHLKTLSMEGYAINDDGNYRLSLKFLEHGGYVRNKMPLNLVGHEYVTELAETYDERVLLGIKEGEYGYFTFRSDDKYGLMKSRPVGQMFYLHQTATGKAILAKLTDEEVQQILDRTGLPESTERTLTDRTHLFDELDRVREQGYATNIGEKSEGIWAVAAAIHDPNWDDVGAISITVPRSKTSKRKLNGDYSEAVINAASSISLELQHGHVR